MLVMRCSRNIILQASSVEKSEMKKGLLLDPHRGPKTSVSNSATLRRVDNLHGRLLMFDSLIVIKEAIPDDQPIIEHGREGINLSFPGLSYKRGYYGRRLVEYPSDADQQYLVENEIARAMAVDGRLNVGEAASVVRDRFAEETDRVYEDGTVNRVEPHDILIPRGLMQSAEGTPAISYEFLDGLCVPEKDVPLSDILAFREKHAEARRAFWDALQEMSDDIEWMHGEGSKVEGNVTAALEEYAAVSQETWGKRVIQTIKPEYVLDRGTIAAFSGILAMQQYFGASPISLLATPLLGLRVSINLLPARTKLSDKAQALSYLDKARRVM